MAGMAVALAGAAGASSPDKVNWGTQQDEYSSDSAFAASKAVCRRLGNPIVPRADRPTPAEARALKGCDSEKLYYGIGVKPDYARARHCAVIEADGGDDTVFSGSTILMQIYANGDGVKRNPDLATAFACTLDGAPFENQARVSHMQDLKQHPERVDFCDDITSGLAQGQCAYHNSRMDAVGRDARLNALVASFPPAARAAFAPLKKAFDAFVDAYGDGEVDLSGTARAAFVIEAEDGARDQFLKDLQRLKSGLWLGGNAADARAADVLLNASYRKALTIAGGKDNYTTIKPDDVRKAQRAWLVYRDAYLRFTAIAAPGVTGDAVLRRLTRLRVAQLDALGSTD